jgi:hypothetical protein
MLHTPTARKAQLIVKELDDETLVYDLERDEAHCLNQTAALVWKCCDGRTTVEEIAKRLSNELQEPVDAKVVWLALAQLRKRRLLLERVPPAATGPGREGRPRISRRELAFKLGRIMVIALPLITTIAAPLPASAGSCGNCAPGGPIPDCCPVGCPCMSPSICCSGVCSAGSCT